MFSYLVFLFSFSECRKYFQETVKGDKVKGQLNNHHIDHDEVAKSRESPEIQEIHEIHESKDSQERKESKESKERN